MRRKKGIRKKQLATNEEEKRGIRVLYMVKNKLQLMCKKENIRIISS